MATTTELARLTSEQITHYADTLSRNPSAPNYIYNLQAPGQSYEDHKAVCKIMDDREQAIRNEARRAEIEAFDTTPAIKAELLARVGHRGSVTPKADDFTSFFTRAVGVKHTPANRPIPAYAPQKGACGVKLLPAKGVSLSYRQEAYSDDSETAIPYVVTEGKPADLQVFLRNVNELCSRARTHNGYAGSGATYSASLRDGFVVLYCRSSISD